MLVEDLIRTRSLFALIIISAVLIGGGAAMPGGKASLERKYNIYATGKEHVTSLDGIVQTNDGAFPNVANFLGTGDPILALYREDLSHEAVFAYFTERTGSQEIAGTILYHAEREGIPISLAFSLAAIESGYNPNAQGRNVGSVDRGLFQLNSNTFPQLSEDDFFDPDTNARYGMRHLVYCFSHTDEPATALAIYNAGLGRVIRGQTPESTKRYVERILRYRAALESDFAGYILARYPPPDEWFADTSADHIASGKADERVNAFVDRKKPLK